MKIMIIFLEQNRTLVRSNSMYSVILFGVILCLVDFSAEGKALLRK